MVVVIYCIYLTSEPPLIFSEFHYISFHQIFHLILSDELDFPKGVMSLFSIQSTTRNIKPVQHVKCHLSWTGGTFH